MSDTVGIDFSHLLAVVVAVVAVVVVVGVVAVITIAYCWCLSFFWID